MDQATLLELLTYNPDTGVFTWNKTGVAAGSPTGNGYIRITIKRKGYQVHNLAWLYMTGEWPEDTVDHRDRNGLNNKWNNLRPATRSQQQANRTCYNKHGFKGVLRQGRRYTAQIGKLKFGIFDTPEEAHLEYMKQAIIIHGEFASA